MSAALLSSDKFDAAAALGRPEQGQPPRGAERYTK